MAGSYGAGVDERKQHLVAAGYDEVAEQYAALEQPGAEWPRLRLLRGLLARLQPGSTVLDLGCGNGIPALREIVRLHEGVGVDLSATQVALARTNVPRAKLIHGDAVGLDFAPGSFDAVVAFYLLDHLPREEHARLFAKAWQWLTPGGLLLFSVEPEDEPANVTEWLGKPMFFSHFDAETTLGLVRNGGFEILDSHREVQVEGGQHVEFLWVLAKREDPPVLPLNRAPVRRVGMMHAVLLYDSDCGFCRWLVDKVLVWDRRGRVKSMELQDGKADSLLGEIDADAKMSSWHLVTPDGRVHSAGAAAPPLLRLLPGGKPLAALLAAFPEGTERAYRTVARNRDRLGRLVGETACRVDPRQRNGA